MSEPGSKRGRTHDAEGAREAILNAAEQVFAEHGFDGARIDAIAEVAGYNKSLIFQYFSDKLGLYAEVIRRADDQNRDMQVQALADLGSAGDTFNSDQIKVLVRKFVGEYFDYLVLHPHILRIYNWEMAEGWQTLTKIISQRDLDDIDQFSLVLNKFKNAQMLRSQFNPVMQMTTAVFFVHTFLGMLPVYQYFLPDQAVNSPAELEQAREFVAELIVAGMFKESSEANRPNSV